jgi:hypothetical protein
VKFQCAFKRKVARVAAEDRIDEQEFSIAIAIVIKTAVDRRNAELILR